MASRSPRRSSRRRVLSTEDSAGFLNGLLGGIARAKG